jgi:dTDP-4-dehydrorhamnose reductase
MKVMITGAQGMLGRACLQVFSVDHVCHGVDIADGDLTNPDTVRELVTDVQPDWVLHTAAYTDVDGAENDRPRASAVNTGATGFLAAECEARNIGLTVLSTDYVFPGNSPQGYPEDAPRDPVNYYGLTKAVGEQAVEQLTTPWQVVRTSWLFGPGERNFVLTIRRLLGERETLKVVDDQHGCPTYAPDLAAMLLFLVEDGTWGYYHATNTGVCTWFDFAREIASLSQADPQRIRPCQSSEYPVAADRPMYSVLLNENLKALGYDQQRGWQAALKDYITLLNSPV